MSVFTREYIERYDVRLVQMQKTSVLAAVRDYLAHGWRPVPLWGVADGQCGCNGAECKKRDWGKHEPLVTDGQWKEGRQFGIADFSEAFNVGLAMGPQARPGPWLVALDADGAFPWDRLGPLPVTRTQATPRGEHRIFTVEPYTPLGNWVDVFKSKPGPSLDLRYARGRIVVAPSSNAFGQYRWVNSMDPQPLPPNVIALILNERRRRNLPVQARWSREGKQA